MSIKYKIPGKPGKDNALFVWINSGTKMYRLLFDCGEGLHNYLEQHDANSIYNRISRRDCKKRSGNKSGTISYIGKV